MTSKSLFFKLMREDLKQRIWAVGLAFLMFFFWLPVMAAMGASNIEREYARWIANGAVFENKTLEMMRFERFAELVENVVGLDNVMLIFTIVCAAFILGLTGFTYLHSKKQVDFYHSIPVRREFIFLLRYVNGVLIILVMYALNLVFALGVFAVNGIGLSQTFGPAIASLVIHMAGFLLIYGLMVLAVLLTGNFFVSILGGIVLFSWVPLVVLLIMGLSELFFQTIRIDKQPVFEMLMLHGSPVSHYMAMIEESSNLGFSGSIGHCVKSFVGAAVFFIAGVILHRLRSSEAAGKAMAFKWSKAPIKFLLVVPCTIAMGILFWTVYYSITWAAFGFLMGLFISHAIIEIIYHFDFRKLFANLLQMGVCAALSLAAIGIFRFDLVGFDRYVPKESDFSSASVCIGQLSNWNDYGLPVLRKDGSYSWNYLNESDYVEGNMQFTDYALVRAVAEAGIARAAENKEKRMQGGDIFYGYYMDDAKSGTYWSYVDIGYRLKNGKTVYRGYSVDIYALRDEIEKIYSTTEYKKGLYPVMNFTADSTMGVYSLKAGQIAEVSTDQTFCAELLSAYQEELSRLTLSERAEEKPVFALRFLSKAELDYLHAITKGRHPNYTGDFMLDDMSTVNFFAVYPSFTRTIELLGQAGIDVHEKLSAEDVERIEICSRYTYKIGSKWNRDKEDYPEYDEYTAEYTTEAEANMVSQSVYRSKEDRWITILENNGSAENRQKIQEVLENVVPGDLMRMNDLCTCNYGLEVRIFLKSMNEGRSRSEQEYLEYYFEDIEIPEFLKAAVGYEEVEHYNISYGLNGEGD
ncbi:MAG: hypothetical protein HFE84_09610 [Lachnospiraceae bacterium]|nr:hypothetical protein [Lachnospiraceae bacterium]